MNNTEKFLRNLMKKADSDEIILKGSCQVCKQPIEMFVSKEMISEGMQGLACDNGGIKVYGEQPVFLCQSCLERDRRLGNLAQFLQLLKETRNDYGRIRTSKTND